MTKKIIISNIRHVAIIMDGNTRWAKKKMMPSAYGHSAGLKSVKNIIQEARHQSIESLSLFALSSENWRRPQKEIKHLMKLFERALDEEIPNLHANNARISFIGNTDNLSVNLKKKIANAEELTRHNESIRINIAVNYGGQWDITNACKRIALLVEKKKISSADITQSLMNEYICLSDQSPIDLCIRTGNEKRISNFFLWQLAYTEFHFSSLPWPEFKPSNFRYALQTYYKRKRRFGDSSNRLV